LSLAADQLERDVEPSVAAACLNAPGAAPQLAAELAHLDRIVQHARQGGLAPLFDLVFAPLFFAALFILHPVIGWAGLGGAAVLLMIAAVGHLASRASAEDGDVAGGAARAFAAGIERQRIAILSMGLGARAFERLSRRRRRASAATSEAALRDGFSSGAARAGRQILQIAILGIGAYLALNQQVSAGAIVAGSILAGRALGPIDQIIGGWNQFVRVRSAWSALGARIAGQGAASEVDEPGISPAPDARLSMEALCVAAPGAQGSLIRAFNLELGRGTLTALVGSNGAGKSSLLNTLAGVWAPFDGTVRLGGRDMHAWRADDRGRYVGYVPQGIELLPGSVRENIARFDPDADDAAVFAAARRAAAHDTIQRLPLGYDTPVGLGGVALSAGQSQLIGLARAFYGEPVLVLLDEPTANLDAEASAGLFASVGEARMRGAVIVVSTHDARLIRLADSALVIRDGTVTRTTPSALIQATPLAAARAVPGTARTAS
jgi:PrtD family type I secretion system ABC transporter